MYKGFSREIERDFPFNLSGRGFNEIFTMDVVSGQILIALILTRKTKKRSSKSDYY